MLVEPGGTGGEFGHVQAAERHGLSVADEDESARLSAMLEVADSSITYRSRYLQQRDPQALIEIGCRVAQNICVARYACIGVLEPDRSEQGSSPRTQLDAE